MFVRSDNTAVAYVRTINELYGILKHMAQTEILVEYKGNELSDFRSENTVKIDGLTFN